MQILRDVVAGFVGAVVDTTGQLAQWMRVAWYGPQSTRLGAAAAPAAVELELRLQAVKLGTKLANHEFYWGQLRKALGVKHEAHPVELIETVNEIQRLAVKSDAELDYIDRTLKIPSAPPLPKFDEEALA